MLQGAEPGPYTEAKTELDLKCQSSVFRRFAWSERGRDGGAMVGRAIQGVTENIQAIGNVYLIQ